PLAAGAAESPLSTWGKIAVAVDEPAAIPGWLTPRRVTRGSRLPQARPEVARGDRISAARLGRRSPGRPAGNPGGGRAGQVDGDADLPLCPRRAVAPPP